MTDEKPSDSADTPSRQSWSPVGGAPGTRSWGNRRASHTPWKPPAATSNTGQALDLSSLRSTLKPVSTDIKNKYEYKRPPPPPSAPPSFATIRLKTTPKKASNTGAAAKHKEPFQPFFATIKLRKTPRIERKPQQKLDDDDHLRATIAREYGKFIIFSFGNEQIKLRKTTTMLRRKYPAGAGVPLDTEDLKLKRAQRNQAAGKEDQSIAFNLRKTPPRDPQEQPTGAGMPNLRKTTPRDPNCPICQFMEQVDLRKTQRRDGESDNQDDDNEEEEVHLELDEAQLDDFCEPCKEMVQNELEDMAVQANQAGDAEVVKRVKTVLQGDDVPGKNIGLPLSSQPQAGNQKVFDTFSIPTPKDAGTKVTPGMEDELAKAEKQKLRIAMLQERQHRGDDDPNVSDQGMSPMAALALAKGVGGFGEQPLSDSGIAPIPHPNGTRGVGVYGEGNVSDSGMSPMGEPESTRGRGGHPENNVSDTGIAPIPHPGETMGMGGYDPNISDTGMSPMGAPPGTLGTAGYGEGHVSDAGMSPMGVPPGTTGAAGFGEPSISDSGMSPMGAVEGTYGRVSNPGSDTADDSLSPPEEEAPKKPKELMTKEELDEELEKTKRQRQRLSGVYMRNVQKPKVELSEEKKRKCYMWYARMSQPNKETMKRRVAKLPPGCDITPEDVEMLPWICGGMMLPVKEMNELFLKG